MSKCSEGHRRHLRKEIKPYECQCIYVCAVTPLYLTAEDNPLNAFVVAAGRCSACTKDCQRKKVPSHIGPRVAHFKQVQLKLKLQHFKVDCHYWFAGMTCCRHAENSH